MIVVSTAPRSLTRYIARFSDGICDSLALDLCQYQPAVVPAAYAGGVADDLPLGFIKAF